MSQSPSTSPTVNIYSKNKMIKKLTIVLILAMASLSTARSPGPDFLFEREGNEIENNFGKVSRPIDFIDNIPCQVDLKEIKVLKGKCVKQGCDTGHYYYPFHQDCMFGR